MGFFDKFKKLANKEEKTTKKKKPIPKKEVKEVKKEKSIKKPVKPAKKENLKPSFQKTKDKISIDRFLKSPWITEKATNLTNQNKYIFKVDKKADKANIKRAVEKMYNVQVIGVNIINIHPKKRRLGRTVGLKSGFKKDYTNN